MEKDKRIQLNNLSKLLYGRTSKWQKMLKKPEIVERKVTLEDGTKKKIKTTSYYTLEELEKIMKKTWEEEQELQAKKELEELAKKQKAMIAEKAGSAGPLTVDKLMEQADGSETTKS